MGEALGDITDGNPQFDGYMGGGFDGEVTAGNVYFIGYTSSEVPEPSTLSCLAVGFLAYVLMLANRQRITCTRR